MKKAIIILAIVTLVSIIYATTMTVHTSSGDVDFEISEITSITFESDGGGTGTVTDIDGNVYQTLVIGDQEWMVENLKVTHYRNGDPIPNVTDNDEWANANNGAYCVYANNESNVDTYGYLYNWYAVGDERGLAPEGWHVPTDDEIKQLEMYLGMSQSEADDIDYRGTNQGSQLAGNAALWVDGALENDPEFGSSGFDLLPGGYRTSSGYFGNLGSYGYVWSATETENYTYYAWVRLLNFSNTQVGRNYFDKRNGFSVRCVRDLNDKKGVNNGSK
jgi:uncharacterized protein (TIGR02145 family)